MRNSRAWEMEEGRAVWARRRSGMEDLSDEVLLEVLEKVGDAADRQAWRAVSRRMRDLEASVRKRVRPHNPDTLEPLLQRFPMVESVDLSLARRVTDAAMEALARAAGPRLRELGLGKVAGFTHAGLRAMAASCSRLRDLDLSNCGHVADHFLLPLTRLPDLRLLRLAKCQRLTDVGLACIAAGCPHLELLTIKCCVKISDKGVAMVAQGCARLRSLDLSFTEVTNECLEPISGLSCLETLHLVRCTNIDDQGLTLLKRNCKSLQKLDVSKCPGVTHAGILSLAGDGGSVALRQLALTHNAQFTGESLARLPSFPSLETVKLDGCTVSEKGLESVGRGCKDLKELSLSKCHGVTDEGMEAVVSQCGALHTLDLTCCRNITDRALGHVTTWCRGLRSLRMEACAAISDAGLASLGLGCPWLEELDLTDTRITDEGLKSVSRCSALRQLKLGICWITDAGVEHIGASCTNLREIDFYRSIRVGDAGIAAIGAGCRRLKTINLSYCRNITDDAMRSLSQLTELHQIEMRGCNRVSSTGLASLGLGFKRLTYLDFKHCQGIGDDGILALVAGCPSLQQINLSHTPVTNVAVLAMADLKCLLHLYMVDMKNVTPDCYQKVLLECPSLKKVKLLHNIQKVVPKEVISAVQGRGCRVRWMFHPLKPASASFGSGEFPSLVYEETMLQRDGTMMQAVGIMVQTDGAGQGCSSLDVEAAGTS